MGNSRVVIAAAAADALAGMGRAGKALVGFDGFIDSIIHMVDVRTDMSATGYTRLATISAFAARCAAAAGRSTNIEQVLIEDRFGGNGPLMAGALAQLGAGVTYIGAVGEGFSSRDVSRAGADGSADGGAGIHRVFAPFARRCERVYAVAAPSTTDCLEFEDGKLMLNNTANIQDVTWERLVERLGLDELRSIVGASSLLGIVNWSLQGGIPGIWRGLMRDVLPGLPAHSAIGAGQSRRVFIDLSDPAKRTDQDLRDALELLETLESVVGIDITLGLNLSEATRVSQALDARAFPEDHARTMGESLIFAAMAIRERIKLDCVVIHPREGAASANAAGEAEWFDGPFTVQPKLSTGAGDHFNGGFAFAQVAGLPLAACLAVGCATSGAYVRDAQSPTRERVIGFLRDLPVPERA